MNHFQNKVCLITGAASGIGMATAMAFAIVGTKVVISDVDEERGRKVEDELQKINDRSFFVPCNIAKKEDVQ
ncbi:MAG: SDR family NAD(P)-dependent oxidoreductase, partial [Flavisolibacter sp.]|nr:SDR family NAD(P)-dependent oxidoreductase [Flavisolibacter sp.]